MHGAGLTANELKRFISALDPGWDPVEVQHRIRFRVLVLAMLPASAKIKLSGKLNGKSLLV